MKNRFNKYLIKSAIICMLFMSTYALKAQIIQYGYDGAGNRVLRNVYVCNPCQRLAHSKMENPPKEEIQKGMEIAMQHGISVYPNPVDDQVNVTVSGISKGETSTIFLMDVTGKLISSQQGSSNPSSFNLKDLGGGIYYIKVIAGTDVLFYRVVKP